MEHQMAAKRLDLRFRRSDIPFSEFDGEPSIAELRAIEAEWPSIEAELRVLDAELALVAVERRGVRRERRLGLLVPAAPFVVPAGGRAA
jgi:hypothetical protein